METTFKIKLSKYYHNPECRKKWVLKMDGWINKYCWIKVWLVSLQLSPKTLYTRNYLKRNVSVTLLRLLSWRMMADSVLLVTHSSSLPIPSGTALWHKCRGSMLLLTNGIAPSYIVDTAPAGGMQWHISGELQHPKSTWMNNELSAECS